MTNNYYDVFSLAKLKNKAKTLQNQELYQILRKPKKDKPKEATHMRGVGPNTLYQSDILYLPNDNGYKYALILVDVSTGITDAEPLKAKDQESILEAFKKIFKRKIFKSFPLFLAVDDGAEFKGIVRDYFINNKVLIKYGKPGRSRQQAYAEQRNKIIGQALLERMAAQELLTDERSTAWVKDLPKIIKAINAYEKKKPKKIEPKIPIITPKTILLSVGQKVRVMYDKPRDYITNNRLSGTFRSGDLRFEPTIRKIKSVLITKGQPPLYIIDGIPHTAYTYNQLSIVDNREEEPPHKVIRGKPSQYVVKEILKKRKLKNRIQFQVRWKGYPSPKDYTWEYKTELMKNPEIKKLINEFENN